MTELQPARAEMTPEELERLWAEHLAGEFTTKDVEATLATMVDDAFVNHMPVNTGGRGKDELRAFYRDDFIPSWPEDLQMTPVNRVIGHGQLVDELRVTFTHSKLMNWFLPNVAPTNKRVTVDFVVVVQFREDKLACERIYWDRHSYCAEARTGCGSCDRRLSRRQERGSEWLVRPLLSAISNQTRTALSVRSLSKRSAL